MTSTRNIKDRSILSESWKAILILIIAFGLFTASSCNNDATPPTIVSSPKITMAPNPDTPLVGVLELSTDKPTKVRIN